MEFPQAQGITCDESDKAIFRELATGWLVANPLVACTIVGATTAAQVRGERTGG